MEEVHSSIDFELHGSGVRRFMRVSKAIPDDYPSAKREGMHDQFHSCLINVLAFCYCLRRSQDGPISAFLKAIVRS